MIAIILIAISVSVVAIQPGTHLECAANQAIVEDADRGGELRCLDIP